jgi:hypothetical protein
MKKIVLSIYMLFILGIPLSEAEWLHNGIPVSDCPYAKTAGEFGAMLVFTDKPDELLALSRRLLTRRA